MIYLLYSLFILSCIVLVVVVLLQPGKADAGALFSSSVSSTAFGPRGTASILAKITIGAAAMFMLTALALSTSWVTGQRSVLQTNPGETPQATPAQQASPTASVSPGSNASPNAAPSESTTQRGDGTKGANANTQSNSQAGGSQSKPSPAK